jgi:hypothetical protein
MSTVSLQNISHALVKQILELYGQITFRIAASNAMCLASSDGVEKVVKADHE